MSNVIDFLERVGQDARLRYASGHDIVVALQSAHVDPEASAAMAAQDKDRLEQLLSVRPKMFCGLYPVDINDEKSDASKQVEQTS